MLKPFITVILMVSLSACAPKYNYRNEDLPARSIDQLLVVIDYTHFVDDVGEMFDYDTDKNKQRIVDIQTALEHVMIEKGLHDRVEFVLMSSGVGFNPEMAFEHYQNSELIEEHIYPPFFIDSVYAEDDQNALLNSLIEAQRIALTSVSEDNLNYLNNVHLTPLNLMVSESNNSDLNHEGLVDILLIRVLSPRVSFVKAMGVSVISAGLTLGATSGAYIGMAVPMGRPHSTALVFNRQSGEVIWKNFTLGDISYFSDNRFLGFFKDFPVKP